ncbi:YccF domain-containing protein [Filimonas effusa]|uniref:YccF domain-containing protein n=1 Tax=Filimonas effusa TaxID=2508721 RepID=A0A4Q1D6Y0_9BACT|nr:YccF domain-containing protein [Filimonas effusa]RXK83796.1 YccF domain-containing protein [Filimonas effusa]
MNLIGNLIWLIFGGFFAALGYLIGGILLCFTIIGIPFGLQCFKLAAAVLMPFGTRVVNRETQNGCLTSVCNIIWLLCGGWYTALTHLFFGLLLYITIIGIPFGKQHFKLLEVSMMPFGKDIV